MADQAKCTWTGESGASYEYFIHQLPVDFNPNQDGNYIFSKKNDKGRWVPIYIGQGDLARRVSADHHQADNIRKKGATHVHVHLNLKEGSRMIEEKDLLAKYTNAYTPHGCNEREGG
jgi:hypothetical protein